MEKIIELNGKECRMVLNFEALTLEEEIMGKGFEFNDFATYKGQLALAWAELKCGGNEMKEFHKWMRGVKSKDLRVMNEASAELIRDFFEIPAVAEEHVPDHSGEGDEEEAKKN